MKIKMIFFMFLLPVLFFNCVEYKTFKQDYEIRQLVDKNIKIKSGSFSYFMVIAGGSYKEEQRKVIQLFALGEYGYEMVGIPIEYVIIKINNDIQKPYLSVSYWDEHKFDLNQLKERAGWGSHFFRFTIVCPEKYLPEVLLPISLERP